VRFLNYKIPQKSNYNSCGDVKKEFRRLFSLDSIGNNDYLLVREQFAEFSGSLLDSLLEYCKTRKQLKVGPKADDQKEK